jgi:transcriptional regulator with XRE-family HTH domain
MRNISGSISSFFSTEGYTPLMTTGQKIKLLRKEKEWSQKELAEATGLTWGIINRYERDRAFPNGESLIKLAKALNVTTDFLVFADAPRTRRIAIKDQDLYEKFLLIEKMPTEDREAVRRLLDGLIVRNKLEDLLPEVKNTTAAVAQLKESESRRLRKVAGKR